jgi:hypothetical protein
MTVSKSRVLVNPGRKRRKRNLSLKQLLHFGTKRQRVAAKSRLKRKKSNPYGVFHDSRGLVKKYRKHSTARKAWNKKGGRTAGYYIHPTPKKRKKNVGTILTVLPAVGLAGGNPGRKRSSKSSMARRKRSSKRRQPAGLRRYWASRKHRANPGRRRRARRSNPPYIRRVKRGRYLYGNPHRRRYRRNPGIMSGTTGRVLGVIGGATLTKLFMGFVPASFQTGFLSYISTGVVAVLQGKLVGKVFKNPSVGNDFLTGGLTYLALRVISDFVPSLSGTLGISGMGIIGGSNYFVPQVPLAGNMGAFVPPAMLSSMAAAPVASGMHGLGSMRRVGRLR